MKPATEEAGLFGTEAHVGPRFHVDFGSALATFTRAQLLSEAQFGHGVAAPHKVPGRWLRAALPTEAGGGGARGCCLCLPTKNQAVLWQLQFERDDAPTRAAAPGQRCKTLRH